MDRAPPPVTVTAPGSGRPPPDLPAIAVARPRPGGPVGVLALLAAVVVGAGVVGGGGTTAPPPQLRARHRRPRCGRGRRRRHHRTTAPAPGPAPPARTATSGIRATASLAGAATDQPYVQRLALTVDLPAFDGRSDGGGRLRGDEVQLVDGDVVRALDRLVSRTCRRPRG